MDYQSILREERAKARLLHARGGDLNDRNATHSEQVVTVTSNLNKDYNNDQIDAAIQTSTSNNGVRTSAFNEFSLQNHLIGTIPNLFYIPNAIEPTDEFRLLESIAFAGVVTGSGWTQLKNRRLQSMGKSLTGNIEDDKLLPPWLQNISDALVSCHVFEGCDSPNHVLINEYKANEGILHHTDGPVYRDTVAILSLESSCLMTFRHKLESQDIGGGKDGDVFSVLLQPRSLLVFSDSIYSLYMHGIADSQSIEVVGATSPCLNMDLAGVKEGFEICRESRTSLTLRKVLDK